MFISFHFEILQLEIVDVRDRSSQVQRWSPRARSFPLFHESGNVFLVNMGIAQHMDERTGVLARHVRHHVPVSYTHLTLPTILLV